MRLTTACFWLGGMYLVLGIVPAALMQVELFAAGNVLPSDFQATLFSIGQKLHRSALLFGAPMALVSGLGMAIFAEARGQVGGVVLGWIALVVSVFLVILGTLNTPSGTIEQVFFGRLSDGAAAIVVSLAGVGVCLTIYADRTARVSRLAYAMLGALMLVGAIGLSRLVGRDGHALLGETYLVIAAQHALGVALVLWAFAVMTAWAARKGQAPETWVSVVLAIGLFGAGAQMVRWTMGLGLAGFPYGMTDYPSSFEPAQRQIGLWAFVFLTFLVAASWRTWRLSRQVPPSPAEVF